LGRVSQGTRPNAFSTRIIVTARGQAELDVTVTRPRATPFDVYEDALRDSQQWLSENFTLAARLYGSSHTLVSTKLLIDLRLVK
jgi:hypothetical protein